MVREPAEDEQARWLRSRYSQVHPQNRPAPPARAVSVRLKQRLACTNGWIDTRRASTLILSCSLTAWRFHAVAGRSRRMLGRWRWRTIFPGRGAVEMRYDPQFYHL